jgi:hypothetical protein
MEFGECRATLNGHFGHFGAGGEGVSPLLG